MDESFCMQGLLLCLGLVPPGGAGAPTDSLSEDPGRNLPATRFGAIIGLGFFFLEASLQLLLGGRSHSGLRIDHSLGQNALRLGRPPFPQNLADSYPYAPARIST